MFGARSLICICVSLLQPCSLTAPLYNLFPFETRHFCFCLQSRDGKSPLHMTAVHGRFTRSQTLIQNGERSSLLHSELRLFLSHVLVCKPTLCFRWGDRQRGQGWQHPPSHRCPLRPRAAHQHAHHQRSRLHKVGLFLRRCSAADDIWLKRLFSFVCVCPKARSPRHVPSPPGCVERSLRLLQEAAVLR